MTLEGAFLFTRVFGDNVCGTFKWYIIPSSSPQSLRNTDRISCCGKSYSPECRLDLFSASNAVQLLNNSVLFWFVPKYRIFFCHLTQESKSSFVSHRPHGNHTVLWQTEILYHYASNHYTQNRPNSFHFVGLCWQWCNCTGTICLAQENLPIKKKMKGKKRKEEKGK